MDCIPAGMELFPAADEEQFQFIKSIVDDCDYYILIIGGRYGSTSPDGLSYTEKEFDYARERGLKVLSFIHEKPGEISFAKSESDPALRARLDSFRDKVKTGNLVKFWSEAKELPGLVSISLNKTIKAHPAIGWVRADQPASTQILNELNEARKLNQKLRKRTQELQDEVQALKPAVKDLAGFEDSFVLSGRYKRPGGSSSEAKLKVTWGELFAAISPHILGQPNNALMQRHFVLEAQALYKAKHPTLDGYWEVSDQDFETVKIQLTALNLVNVSMKQTTEGGQALFWFLTPLGELSMLKVRTVKKNMVGSSDPPATS
jgi:Domain of unknown function (DUF4062)